MGLCTAMLMICMQGLNLGSSRKLDPLQDPNSILHIQSRRGPIIENLSI